MAGQILSALVGIWMMLAPDFFGFQGIGRTHHYIVGPVVATFGTIAIWEHMRFARWANVWLGAWTVLSAVPLGGREMEAILNAFVCGGLIALCSLKEGTYRPERFGGGWAALFRKAG